jgi:hypothetical protein
LIDHYSSQGWEHDIDTPIYTSRENAERALERTISDPDNVEVGFNRNTLRVTPCHFKIMQYNERQSNWEDCTHPGPYGLPNRYETMEDAELSIDTIMADYNMDRDQFVIVPVSIAANSPNDSGRLSPRENNENLPNYRYRVEVLSSQTNEWTELANFQTLEQADERAEHYRQTLPVRNIRINRYIDASSSKSIKTAQFDEDFPLDIDEGVEIVPCE